MIRMRGYEGDIATLRRHVAEVRPLPRGEVYLRTERLIGEQAQVDWAHVGSLAVAGGTRPLWVFVSVTFAPICSRAISDVISKSVCCFLFVCKLPTAQFRAQCFQRL